MSNNRTEILRGLDELKIEYESLDRFFYSNFKIESDSFKPYIKAKPYACCEYSIRIDSGWFDNYEKKELDKRNRYILLQIEQDVNKLISLYKSYDIKE